MATSRTRPRARSGLGSRDQLVQDRGEAVQLGEMRRGQLAENALALSGQPRADDAGIAAVGDAPHKVGCLGPVDQLHGAVMALQQIARQLADGGRLRAGMALDCHQQLVLDVGKAGRTCLVLTPPLEPAQAGDGVRVLVDRVWPRGVKKADAKLDDWPKDLAPSTGLREWYGHDPAKFSECRSRYRTEPDAPDPSKKLGEVAALAAKRPVTLLTATRDIDISQAAVLAELLGAGKKRGS